MDAIKSLLDIFLHARDHLEANIEAWGPWTYVLLFVIILCETGLVVTPFLPGDSLQWMAVAALVVPVAVTWLVLRRNLQSESRTLRSRSAARGGARLA